MGVIAQELSKLEKVEEEKKEPVEEEEIVYDSEFERVKDQYKELEEVFKNFALKEASQSEGLSVAQVAAGNGEDGKVNEKQAETGVIII